MSDTPSSSTFTERIKQVSISVLRIAALTVVFLPPIIALDTMIPSRGASITPSMKPSWMIEHVIDGPDGVQLHVWDSGTPAERTIVLQHGLDSSKAEWLDRVMWLRDFGFRFVLMDLRGHGLTEGGWCSLGAREHRDLLHVIRELEIDRGTELTLWGHSLGAVTVALAAPQLENLEHLILEAPFDTARNTINHHRTLLPPPIYIPRYPFIPLMVAWMEVATWSDLDEVDVPRALREIDVPILFIAGSNDDRMPPTLQRELRRHSKSRESRVWVCENAGHADTWWACNESLQQTVGAYLEILAQPEAGTAPETP